MLITPAQVAFHADRFDAVTPTVRQTGARWTWIAGRRYRGVRRL